MTHHRFLSSPIPSSLESLDRHERLLHESVRESGRLKLSASRPHSRKPEVHPVSLPARTMSMSVGILRPLQGSDLQRHNYETLMYITAGSGFSLIGETHVAWTAGDAIYIPVWQWHKHVNTSETAEATYVACENTPLLQTLGIALREQG